MKPIIFSTPMVQAILAGKKSQTRRVIKPQPQYIMCKHPELGTWHDGGEGTNRYTGGYGSIIAPKYAVNDVLWVRETWNGDWCDHVIYKADGGSAKAAGYSAEPKWKPSIHMPKAVARLFLRVTDIRVEQIQDISYDNGDIWAEGIPATHDRTAEINSFINLWESINGKRDGCSWQTNPWVWVYTFERYEGER